jgi:hypothetical protein
MVQNLHFTSWLDMKNQTQDIIDLLKKNEIKGIESKEKEFKRGNLDNKYSIWVELKVAEYLFQKKIHLEITSGKAPDIKVSANRHIEVKRIGKENFKEQKLILNLIEHLNRNFPEWGKINFQLSIEYSVGSSIIVNEKRNVKTILLNDDWLKNQLYQDIVNALKQKKEKDNKVEFYPYKFSIVYFNNYNIKANRKFFISNSYSGDNEKWLRNKINILAAKAKKKFSCTNFNILFIYYPFIKRDFMDDVWEEISLNIWNDIDIKKIYSAIILSDFSKYFKIVNNKNDQKIIDTLFYN